MRFHFFLPALVVLAAIPSGAFANCVKNDLGVCTTSTISSKSVVCGTQTQPVCARQYVQCFTTPCLPIKQDFANVCEMRSFGAKFLYTGVCKSDAEWEDRVTILTEKIETRIREQGEQMRLRYARAMQSLCPMAKTDRCRQMREVRANIMDNRKAQLSFEEMKKVFSTGLVERMETQHNGLVYILMQDGQKFTSTISTAEMDELKNACSTCSKIPLLNK